MAVGWGGRLIMYECKCWRPRVSQRRYNASVTTDRSATTDNSQRSRPPLRRAEAVRPATLTLPHLQCHSQPHTDPGTERESEKERENYSKAIRRLCTNLPLCCRCTEALFHHYTYNCATPKQRIEKLFKPIFRKTSNYRIFFFFTLAFTLHQS